MLLRIDAINDRALRKSQVAQSENPGSRKQSGFLLDCLAVALMSAWGFLAAMEVRREQYPKQRVDILPRHREVRVRHLQVFFCLVPSCGVLPD